LPTGYGLVSDTTNYLDMSRYGNKLAISRCNAIWEMTQQNGLLPATTCYRLVAKLLPGSYGETGVMDFGLKHKRHFDLYLNNWEYP